MHTVLQIAAFWALAFGTLVAALVLLNIYYGLLGSDVVFRSVRQEAAIAASVSLIQGASAWVLLSFVPAAIRAMFLPILVAAIIYKLSHLEDWNRYHILSLFLFQFALGAAAGCFYSGHVSGGLLIIAGVGAFLVILWAVVKNL